MSYAVTIWSSDGEEAVVEADEIEFVSLVNHETYGIPPIFKDRPDVQGPVLYINTTCSRLLAFEISKESNE